LESAGTLVPFRDRYWSTFGIVGAAACVGASVRPIAASTAAA
jgi:hypothetical protein